MWTTSSRDSIKKDKNISCERFGIELALLWRRYAPELRFMQFMLNFQTWLEQENKNDGFYLEDYEVIQKIEEWCKTLKHH